MYPWKNKSLDFGTKRHSDTTREKKDTRYLGFYRLNNALSLFIKSYKFLSDVPYGLGRYILNCKRLLFVA